MVAAAKAYTTCPYALLRFVCWIPDTAQFLEDQTERLNEEVDVAGDQLDSSILENKPQRVGGEVTQGKRDGFENAGLDDIFSQRTPHYLSTYRQQCTKSITRPLERGRK